MCFPVHIINIKEIIKKLSDNLDIHGINLGVAEKYMKAALRCAVRVTEGFDFTPRLNSELLLVCSGDDEQVDR